MASSPSITFNEAVKKYSRQLLSFIRGKTKTMEDAEDILQEVWFQFSRLANINELENMSAWLYTISRNKITDLYRKRKEVSIEDYLFDEGEESNVLKSILLLDESNNPELALFKEMFWAELYEGLEQLPPEQKLVFVENELEDKTLQQISNEQGVNLKTIISRKVYANKYLRKKLLPLYNEIIN